MNKLPGKPLPELSPEALSFIPLFYVGWSDSVLSPSEMDHIHKQINQYEFLSRQDKDYLIRWTDPRNPPSDEDFRQWLMLLRRAAGKIRQSEKTTLVNTGIEMARLGVGPGEDNWQTEKVVGALHEMKKALGLDDESERALSEVLGRHIMSEISDAQYTFDPAKLRAILDGDTSQTRERLRKLLRDPIFSLEYEPDHHSHRKITLRRLKELAKQGFSGFSFPEAYGGNGRFDSYIAVFEMLGYTDLSLAIKFGVQYGLFGGAVYQLGTETHHKAYLPELISADLLGCFAMTETGHGSNVKNLETTATYDHSTREIVINSPTFTSGKEYIGNALDAHKAVVFAQLIVNNLRHGVHAIVVPLRDPDGHLYPRVRVEDNGYKMGLNGVDNGRIWFDNIRVPVSNLLDKYGRITPEGVYESPIKNDDKRFFTMLGALVAGRISVGLLGINASKKALTIALKYAIKRRQFAPKDGGKEVPIIDYPTHQKRLLPLLASTYAYYFALDDLAQKYINSQESEKRDIETLAAGLKAKATWHTTQTIQECREACGGKGYLSENSFPALKADTDIFTTFEGDNTVLMQLVAKGLLTGFQQSLHDDGYRAVLRFLLTKVRHEVYENNPLFRRNTDSEHLQDESFHFHAFKYRKKKTLISLAERMRKYLKRGMDPFQAFLKVQIHMIDLADAYIDEVVLTSFYNRIEQCDNAELAGALKKLAQVYAMSTLEKNKGWYLETEYMDGSKTKAMRRVLQKLYRDMKKDIPAFVDAFGIPDELLGAKIVTG